MGNKCGIEAEKRGACEFFSEGDCCNGLVAGISTVCNENSGIRSGLPVIREMAAELMVLKAAAGGLGERGKMVRERLDAMPVEVRRVMGW